MKRQPEGDQRLRIASVNAAAEPQRPPAAIWVNQDARYVDFIASSAPFEVMARVRRNESPTRRGRSTRTGGKDNRKDLRKGEKYSSKCTKLQSDMFDLGMYTSASGETCQK